MHLTKHIVGILAIAASMAAFSPQNAAAKSRPGEKTVYVQTGYAGYNNSALAGLEFSFRFTNHFRIAPSANYMFRHEGKDALTINLNFQMPFEVLPALELYPLAGITYASWNFHPSHDDTEDVTTRLSRFGLRFGGGAALRLTGNLRLGLDVDYVVIKDFSDVEAFIKIGYSF